MTPRQMHTFPEERQYQPTCLAPSAAARASHARAVVASSRARARVDDTSFASRPRARVNPSERRYSSRARVHVPPPPRAPNAREDAS